MCWYYQKDICFSARWKSPAGKCKTLTLGNFPACCPSDLTFVTNITNIIGGEKIVIWRNFSFPWKAIVARLKISPHAEFQMPPHDRCGEIWNSTPMTCVRCRKRRHKCKIYAIFMWRKIEPKSTFVEKKWQIWGLLETPHFHNGGPLPMVTKLPLSAEM